jgi:hypothetical protein|tara:strand:- start:28 stop:201 length:174 start_codon:yes stop_codon:yes gene_type:complete
MNKQFGIGDKCRTKLEFKNVDGIGKRAAKHMIKFKETISTGFATLRYIISLLSVSEI